MDNILCYSLGDSPDRINRQAMDMSGDFILCSRAGLGDDLADELARVLRLSTRYAVVSPRMQDGSFLSLPSDWDGHALSDEQLSSLQEAARRYLPSSSIVPYAGADCCLIRRELIDRFGFLDCAFSTVRGALIDYCMRLRRHGYFTAVAHHSFADGLPKSSLKRSDHALLMKRHPDFSSAQEEYLRNGLHACDYFLTVLAERYYPKRRLLLNFINMPASMSGGVQVRLTMLEYLSTKLSDAYDLFVCAPPEAVRYHHLRKYNVHIVEPDNIRGVYHLSYCSTQPFYMGMQFELTRHCLKNVYTLLDVILCRCDYLQKGHLLRDDITRFNAQYCDGLLFISQFSADDYDAYFSLRQGAGSCKRRVVYLSSSFSPLESGEERELPFSRYILVPGSRYAHKGLSEVLEAVRDTSSCYITIGLPEEGLLAPNVFNYRGGGLDEAFVRQLYRQCDYVLFPSHYEGFGLPVLQGAQCGKRVVVLENAVNRELLQAFPRLSDYLVFIRRFGDIPTLPESLANEAALAPLQQSYSQECFAAQTVSFLEEVLAEPTDAAALQTKWHSAVSLAAY